MTRKEELLKVFENIESEKKTLVAQVIEEVVFLEEQLVELKKYPFIKFHPTDPSLQKPTVAGKQYKELLQQYNNSIKLLHSVLNKNEAGEESPLREFLRLKGLE